MGQREPLFLRDAAAPEADEMQTGVEAIKEMEEKRCDAIRGTVLYAALHRHTGNVRAIAVLWVGESVGAREVSQIRLVGWGR